MEQRKANSLPRSRRPHAGAAPSSPGAQYHPPSVPAGAALPRLQAADPQHGAAGGEDARGVWDCGARALEGGTGWLGHWFSCKGGSLEQGRKALF